ncbi:hypothetical protein G4G28_03270 [Massilia sp. Dwa41.01b]|uniref:hypothetical protein n=1 Tax=Massilia sp. Dwa41.01b TaxID=2709302 RepID=UPI0016000D4E|nr:hypothetical protein [Massilia sp. Dwa41.01b]QNA87735.1 hypothetical protein G4G28_03270 [Massilia sp. Dwa41.01b]
MDTRHPPDHLPDPLGDTAELDLRLAGLREALSAVDTPRCVDKELMQAFQAQFSRRPRYRRLGALEWIATALAGGLGAAMLALLLVPPRLAGDGYPQAPCCAWTTAAHLSPSIRSNGSNASPRRAWSRPTCHVRYWPHSACRSIRNTRATASAPKCWSTRPASRLPCAWAPSNDP